LVSARLADGYAAPEAENPRLTSVGGAAVKVPLPWFEAPEAPDSTRQTGLDLRLAVPRGARIDGTREFSICFLRRRTRGDSR